MNEAQERQTSSPKTADGLDGLGGYAFGVWVGIVIGIVLGSFAMGMALGLPLGA